MTQQDFMRRAIALSQQQISNGHGGPFGAVIVKDGVIIAEGGNEVTSTNDPTAHAEMVAIRKACAHLSTFSLEGCELYASCEPCPMCLSAIYWARISRIYYGNGHADAAAIGFDDAFLFQEIPKPVGERRIPTLQLLPDEARCVFEAWHALEDKIAY